MIDERKILLAIQDGAIRGLIETQVVLARVVRSYLSQPGTGRVYRVGKGSQGARNLREAGFHKASAPGRPPAVNTNRLRASWSISARAGIGRIPTTEAASGFVRERRGPTRIGFEYGSNVRYAKFLEFGTRRMRSRPYLRPVMRRLEPRVAGIVNAAVARQIGSTR